MTEKTAMQQMIDFITSEEYPHLYTAVKDEWFKTFIEKEKQQIIDAYSQGVIDMVKDTKKVDYSQYVKDKFGI